MSLRSEVVKNFLQISPNCVFEASLVPETCLEFSLLPMCGKLGAPKAITTIAHRLARLVNRMLKYRQEYVDKGAEYERRNRQQQIEFLRKKAAQLGLQVTAAHP